MSSDAICPRGRLPHSPAAEWSLDLPVTAGRCKALIAAGYAQRLFWLNCVNSRLQKADVRQPDTANISTSSRIADIRLCRPNGRYGRLATLV